MFKIIKYTFFVTFLLVLIPKKTRTQNPDVVAAMQPIQGLLKKILSQDTKSFNVYKKMKEYQEKLKKVYEIQSQIKGMQTYIEVVKMLEEFACSLRELDELLSNPRLRIPINLNIETAQSCAFNFKYKKVLSGFTLANDMLNMTMSTLQMTASDRMSALRNSFNQLDNTYDAIESLKRDIIKNNI
tara:strand:+ start:49 stop:603 length:555 start_codon:yes stop_codon:yes gene_type:complete